MTKYRRLLSCILVSTAAAHGWGGCADHGSSSSKDGSPTTFALKLDLTSVDYDGSPVERAWSVVVRADDGTVAAFESHQNDPSGTPTLQLVVPGLHTDMGYGVGISTAYVPSCATATSGFWYERVEGVTGDTTIKRSMMRDVPTDARACDLFHQPVQLEPGTYKNTSTILGYAQNGIELLVSPTRRLYVQRAMVLCPNPPPGCNSSLTSLGPVCDNAATPNPGETSFVLDGYGDATTLEGTATIDGATNTIKYSGTVTTYKAPGSSTVCCSSPVEVTIGRSADASDTCI